MDCNLPGSSVRGILQARILEWVAIPFSMRSSQPGDRTRSPDAGRSFTSESPGKSPCALGWAYWQRTFSPATYLLLESFFCLVAITLNSGYILEFLSPNLSQGHSFCSTSAAPVLFRNPSALSREVPALSEMNTVGYLLPDVCNPSLILSGLFFILSVYIIGVDCRSLLQGILPTQGLNLVSCIAGRFFTVWATREVWWLCVIYCIKQP